MEWRGQSLIVVGWEEMVDVARDGCSEISKSRARKRTLTGMVLFIEANNRAIFT